MDSLDNLRQGVDVGSCENVVVRVLVVGANVDDDYVGSGTLAEVPRFGLVWNRCQLYSHTGPVLGS